MFVCRFAAFDVDEGAEVDVAEADEADDAALGGLGDAFAKLLSAEEVDVGDTDDGIVAPA